MDLEKYFFFDESGDPVNGYSGYSGEKNIPIFFVGCVHGSSLQEIELVHDSICSKISRNSLHYAKLSKVGKSTAFRTLIESPLKFDIGITLTANFQATKNIATLKEKRREPFIFSGGAKYAKFDEMCQTEMFAMLTWLIFAEETPIGSPNYERPLRLLGAARENPEIKFDQSIRVNVDVWKTIHLDRQIKKYGLDCLPEPVAFSKGIELADILVSGYVDKYLATKGAISQKLSNIVFSIFHTNGETISMEREPTLTQK